MLRILIVLVASLLYLLPAAAGANEGQVTHIEPVMQDGQMLISADIDFTLGDELHEAAGKGVPLYFTVDLKILRPRWWWFDQTIATASQTWRIQFNALTRQWRVGTGDLTLPATSLDEALDLVRHIRDWPIDTGSRLRAGTRYQGRLRLRLDTSRLARPFQVDAINSNAWSLTTPWKNFNFSISATTPQG